MDQNKRRAPFQSSLIPYQKVIFHARFNEGKSFAEIQAILQDQNVNVAISTISRFINVRQKRPNPYVPTANLKTYWTVPVPEKQNNTSAENGSSNFDPEDIAHFNAIGKMPGDELVKQAAVLRTLETNKSIK